LSTAFIFVLTFLEAVLFPTWHRPYLLALEVSVLQFDKQVLKLCHQQSIGEAAAVIAKKLTKGLPDSVKKEWDTAAQQLRWPYVSHFEISI
jgi:tyrosinase